MEAGALTAVHVMVASPERHIGDFARAGADVITIHVEAAPPLRYAVRAVCDGSAGRG